jgi:flagellin-like hook-associated protein FlgL
MSSIPNNLARVPQLLSNNVIQSSLARTQQLLLQAQVQLASGYAVNRPSDDAVASSAISIFDDVIERRGQLLRNLSHGESLMNNVDAALGDVSEMLIEAKGISLSQIGVGSTASTRESQAAVIDAMLAEMFNTANREYQDIYFFGGAKTDSPPMRDLLGGMQYTGAGEGMVTDLGISREFPVTVNADRAFGAMSARVQGARDLNPELIDDTRLVDLNGAVGFGVRLGSIAADVNGTDITIDLGTAHTIGDVAVLLEDAIQTELDTSSPGETVSVTIDPTLGNRLSFSLSAGATVTLSDITAEASAADLGIVTTLAAGATTTGGDLNPRITEHTLIASLDGVTAPLGTLRLENGGQMRELDLSSATNVQDIMNAVAGLKLGIRVEVDPGGDRLNFINELSGGQMSISEVSGGKTATELGVRTLDLTTDLSQFNGGRGVQILSGNVDPSTGLADPDRDYDFKVTLKDGTEVEVDLAGASTVQDVLTMINDAAAGAGLTVGTGLDFVASLNADGNGISLEDNTTGTTTVVEQMNGSFAAHDLGIIGESTSAVFAGEDRAYVAVDGVFSRLIGLRDALYNNDERGISFAAEGLDRDIDRVAKARAEVGVRSNRIATAVRRQEDLRLQDTALRSDVRDLDYTEAAIRFTQLQQQLQAALTTAGRVTSLSLLDFLQ